MLRFIHTSNINIGKTFSAVNKNLSDEASKIIEQSFFRLIKDSREKNIDALIIAGNLFSSNSPSEKSVNYVMDMLKSIPEVKVFIIPGEFDYLALRMLQKNFAIPKNVYVFNNYLESYKIKNNVTIYGIGYNPLLCGENIKSVINQKLDNQSINILCFYGAEDEDNCNDTGIEHNHHIEGLAFKNEDISSMGFDYAAIGKYSGYEKILSIGNTLMAACSGELVTTNSYLIEQMLRNGDTVDRGGYIYTEVDKSRSNYSFQANDMSVFSELKIDIEGCRDSAAIAEKIRQELKQQGIYIVILEGKAEVDFCVDEEEIINELNNERVIKIIDKTFYREEECCSSEIYNSAREIFIKSVTDKLKNNNNDFYFYKDVLKYGISALKKDERRMKYEN